MASKKRIDIQIEYLENLSHVNIDILSIEGGALTGQDILNAVSDALLLKWEHYDLEGQEDYDA